MKIEQKHIDRFMAMVDRPDWYDCWIWTGARTRKGYGEFRLMGKVRRAHRLSWMIHNGYIPEGMCVCHHCDNPSCVNPDHLWLGTDSENHADRDSKGRTAKGERSGTSRLTEADVLEVWRLHYEGLSYEKIARAVGTSDSTVNSIINRQAWRHVPPQ